MIASAGARIRRVRRSSLLRVVAATGALVVGVPACGKKGPPLPPLVNRPRAPEAVSARRLGNEVQVRFTVPRVNQSGVQPANIERVDVYAVTGPKLGARDYLEHAAVVASVPVRPPPPPEEEQSTTPRGPVDPVAVEQGAQAVVTEALTSQALRPIELPEKERRARPSSDVVVRRTELAPPDVATPVVRPVQRHYAVVGVSRGGDRGAMSAQVSVSLAPAPSAPAQPSAAVREKGVEVTWERPPAMRGFGGEPPDDDAADSADAQSPEDGQDTSDAIGEKGTAAKRTVRPLRSRSYLPWPAVRSGFNLYAVPPGKPDPSDGSPYAASRLPQLLTPRPITTTRFMDSGVAFGQERCYVVRAVETTGPIAIESPASPTTCVKVADVFPPSPPRSLAAVAAERSINLIWEANTDADLAGYLVLRGADGGALEPVFKEPIRDTTWRDTAVTPGVKYRYAVIAVDNAVPGNRSNPSNEVEASLR